MQAYTLFVFLFYKLYHVTRCLLGCMTGPQTAHLDALNIAIQYLFSEHHAFACDHPPPHLIS